MEVRLNKFLSQSGVASRREADRMIAEGRVRVNGRVVIDLGTKVDGAEDVVQVDGKKIRKEDRPVYVMLNKPAGYLVTMKDRFQRPTVGNLLPRGLQRVFHVGRLDLESEGLLLLTNDGELAYRLTHPRYEVRKTYVVKVKGRPEKAKLSRLEKGVFIDGKRTAPARVHLLYESPNHSVFRVAVHEGRKREIRRMCEAVGHSVRELRRVQFAGLTLKGLKPGEWRPLTAAEVKGLKKEVGLD